jgi:hypothetical protein
MRELYSFLLSIVAGLFIVIVTVIFAMIQSPEILYAPEREFMSIPHTIKGRIQCDGCHGIKGIKPYPIRHLGWSNESCMKCHLPAVSEVIDPLEITPAPPLAAAPDAGVKDRPADRKVSAEEKIPPITHPIEGWEECIKCHSVDSNIMPAPEDHKNRGNDICTKCHVASIPDNKR